MTAKAGLKKASSAQEKASMKLGLYSATHMIDVLLLSRVILVSWAVAQPYGKFWLGFCSAMLRPLYESRIRLQPWKTKGRTSVENGKADGCGNQMGG